jgi:hypothetical protein
MAETIPAGLAKLVGKAADGSRTWLVDGKFVSDEELDVLVARQYVPYETEHLLNAVVGGESWRGVATQRKADEILRRRGIQPEDASQAELLDALRRVSP